MCLLHLLYTHDLTILYFCYCYISPSNKAINAFCKWCQIVCIHIISLHHTKQHFTICEHYTVLLFVYTIPNNTLLFVFVYLPCVCFAFCILLIILHFYIGNKYFLSCILVMYYTKSSWCDISFVFLNAQNIL